MRDICYFARWLLTTAYLVYIVYTQINDVKVKDIPIVKKYLDVFPDDIFRLPLDKNVEFTIDFILGITLISIALYRMIH